MSISISNTVATPSVNSATSNNVVSSATKPAATTAAPVSVAKAASVVTLSAAATGSTTSVSISDALKMDVSTMKAVTISDTSDNFTKYFGDLQGLDAAKKITSVSFVDSNPSLTFTSGEVSDLPNGKASVAGSLLGKVSTDFRLNITGLSVSDALADAKSSISHATYKLSVTDTAANISSNFTAIQNSSAIQTVTSFDGNAPIQITATQYKAELAKLDAIDNAATPAAAAAITSFKSHFAGAKFAISDVSAADATNFATNTNVVSMSLKDTGANLVTNEGAIDTLTTATRGTGSATPAVKIDSITVTDGKLNVTQDDVLAGSAQRYPGLYGANFTSPVSVNVTGVTAGNAKTVFDNLKGANSNLNVTERISDTAANMLANIDKLQGMINAQSNVFSKIEVSDGFAVTMDNSAILAQHINLLSTFSKSFTLKVSDISAADAVAFKPPVAGLATELVVKDTAANISANFDALIKSNAVKAINVTGTANVQVTGAQFSNYSTAITAKMTHAGNPDGVAVATAANFNVVGAKASDAATLHAATNVDSYAVTDTGANLLANLTQLKADQTRGKLASLTVADGKITLTAAQAVVAGGNQDFFKNVNLTSPVQVTVTGVSTTATDTSDYLTSDVMSIHNAFSANANITVSQNIVDTSGTETTSTEADIIAKSIQAGANISSVVAKGGTIHLADMTQFNADAAAVAKAANATIKIDSLTAAQALDPMFAGAKTDFTVVDTAANISQNFDALTNAKGITQVKVIGDEAISISGASFNGYNLSNISKFVDNSNGTTQAMFNVMDAKAADATALHAKLSTSVKSYSVTDTGANIAANLTNLVTDGASLTALTVTDGKLNLDATARAATWTADKSFLNSVNLAGPVTLTVDNVAMTQASGRATAVMDNVNNLSANDNINLVQNVKDTLSNSGAKTDLTEIDALQNAINQGANIGKITAQASTVEVADMQQFTNNADALGKIGGLTTLKINSISVADALSTQFKGKLVDFTVKDTAANISANFDTLAKMKGVTSVVSDANQSITVTAAAYTANKTNLTKFDTSVGGQLQFAVTGIKANQIGQFNTTDAAYVSSYSIADTGANIAASASLTALNSATASKIDSITVTDGKLNIQQSDVISLSSATPPVVSTANEKLWNATFTSPVNVTVSNVAGANVMDVNKVVGSNENLTVIQNVNDGAAITSSEVDNLEAAFKSGVHFGKIEAYPGNPASTATVTDMGQYNSDLDVLSKLSNTKLTFGSITAQQALDPQFAKKSVAFTIKDTAANISANFDAIVALGSKVTAVNLTKDEPINVSAQQYAKNTAALAKFKLLDGSSTAKLFNVSNVKAADISTLNGDAKVANYSITDTGANLVTKLATLGGLDAAHQAKISSITVTDNKMIIEGANATANPAAFLNNATFTSPVNVTVNNVAAANVLTVNAIAGNANLNVTQNIKDASGDVTQAELDQLEFAAKAGVKFGKVEAAAGGVVKVDSMDKYNNDIDVVSNLANNPEIDFASVTAAQALDPKFANTKAVFNVTDTAQNISANLSALMKTTSVNSVQVGSAGGVVNVTSDQFNAYKSQIGTKFNSVFVNDATTPTDKVTTFAITDVKAADVDKILNKTTGWAATAGLDTTGALSNFKIDSISIKDTGANIVAKVADIQAMDGTSSTAKYDLSGLNRGSAATILKSIEVTDGKMTVDAANAWNEDSSTTPPGPAIAHGYLNLLSSSTTFKASSGGPVALTVTGLNVLNSVDAAASAASVSAHHAALPIGNNINDMAAATLSKGLQLKLNVVANGADLTTDMISPLSKVGTGSLAGVGLVSAIKINAADVGGSITAAHPATIELVSYDQYKANADALKLIKENFTLKIDSMSVAQYKSLMAKPLASNVKLSIGLVDSGSNITDPANLDNINGLAKAGTVTSINVASQPAVSLTGDQLANYKAVTDILTHASLTLSGIKAGDVAGLVASTNTSFGASNTNSNTIASIGVTDTRANIAAQVSVLNTNNSVIKSIALDPSDTGTANPQMSVASATTLFSITAMANVATFKFDLTDSVANLTTQGLIANEKIVSKASNLVPTDRLAVTGLSDAQKAEWAILVKNVSGSAPVIA